MNNEKKGKVSEEGRRCCRSQEEVNTAHLAAEAAVGGLGSPMRRRGEGGRRAGL